MRGFELAARAADKYTFRPMRRETFGPWPIQLPREVLELTVDDCLATCTTDELELVGLANGRREDSEAPDGRRRRLRPARVAPRRKA